LGFYHLNIGNTAEAIDALKRSINLLNQGDFDTKNVHSYFLLQDIYYNQGRYREAYEALMAFSETYTRQHNRQGVVELSKLLSDLEVERAEQEHLRREEEYKRQQDYNKMITIFYVLSILVIMALVFLLLSRFRLERKNRELQRAQTEQELNHKNEIIKIQKLQQYQEQNYIDKLTEELSSIGNLGNNKEMQIQIRRIIHQLQSNSKSGNGWAEVEMTLAGGNNIFYENLLRDYPNLTKNERKLCLFIHMKMSTKEISDITHQSLGSINVARSRLRQKFGLTGDETSLIAFLDQYNTQQTPKQG
jgi:tetratricopeptide (TPR) repeat protein